MRVTLISLLITGLLGCSTFGSDNKDKSVLYLQMGLSQFENGNYPGALKSLLEAERLDPANPVIQNNLGLTYFMREHYDLSEKHFKKALQLEPKFSEARNNLARVLIEEAKYPAAEAELKIVLDDLTYSGFAKAYSNLGLSKFNQNQFSEAAKAFTKALDVDREDCTANTYYGRSLFEMKDYPKAASALDRGISFCQKQLFDEPHYFSALTYYRLGQKRKSIARFEEVVKLYPNGRYRDKAQAMLDLIRKDSE